MGRWPTGVTVVTGHDAGVDVGLTVNAFLSVSLNPPLLLVSLSHDADSTPVISRSGRFTVNLLSHAHRSISERFAQPHPVGSKFEGLAIVRGPGQVPRLGDAIAAFECRVQTTSDAGDHRLFIGEVDGLHLGADEDPLLFVRSRYVTPGADGSFRLSGV